MGRKSSEDPSMEQTKPSERFRLHLGGLSPTVTAQDLARRFSSFGRVIELDGVGKLDANGVPLKYGFVVIESTESQIKRCMNLLSGTTYKGDTLRIAPARPNYEVRLAQERAGLPTSNSTDPDEEELRALEEKLAQKRQKKMARLRARKRGIEGYESSNMQLMTVKRFKSRENVYGWKKEPDTSLPIFPLITRPLHPIPRLVDPSRNLDSRDDKGIAAQPPNRARRIRIDPVIYRAAIKNRKTHILGPRAISIEQYRLGFAGGVKGAKTTSTQPPLWQCEITESGEAIWRLEDGPESSLQERVRLSTWTFEQLKEPKRPRSDLNPASRSSDYESDLFISYQSCKSLPSLGQPCRGSERFSHLEILRTLDLKQNSIIEDLDPVTLQQVDHEEQSKPTIAKQTFNMLDRIDSLDVSKRDHESSLQSLMPEHDSEKRIQISSSLPPAPGFDYSEKLPTSDALRLRGGSGSQKRARSSKQATELAIKTPPKDLVQTDTGGQAIDIDDISTQLRIERQKYISIASQVVTRPRVVSTALEDVGQGSRDAVERQKIKESRSRAYDPSSPEQDSGIQFVPQNLISGSSTRIREPNPVDDQALSLDLETSRAATGQAKRYLSERDSEAPSLSSASGTDSPPAQEHIRQSLGPSCNFESNLRSFEEEDTNLSETGDKANPEVVVHLLQTKDVHQDGQPEGSRTQIKSLTEMFKAKATESTGFRLSDVLDEIELEDEYTSFEDDETKSSDGRVDLDNQSKSRLQKMIHPSRLADNMNSSTAPLIGVNRPEKRGLFFKFRIDEDFEPGGIFSNLSVDQSGQLNERRKMDYVNSSDGWRTFVMSKSDHQIKAEHEEKRGDLTELMRRTHKDAIKQSNKWGHAHHNKSKIDDRRLLDVDEDEPPVSD